MRQNVYARQSVTQKMCQNVSMRVRYLIRQIVGYLLLLLIINCF